VLPLIRLGRCWAACRSGPIAMRTRADVFAIVTITLLFVGQTLAFNLRASPAARRGRRSSRRRFPPTATRFLLRRASRAAGRLDGADVGDDRSKSACRWRPSAADEEKAAGIASGLQTVKLLAFCVSSA